VEGAIHAIDPALPGFGERSLEASIATRLFRQRMGGSLLGVFGGSPAVGGDRSLCRLAIT